MSHSFLHHLFSIAVVASTGLFVGCTNIDCPLDNQVEMVLNFYSERSGQLQALTLTDTLSVFGMKGDTTELLFNRGISHRTINLPLNVAADRDTLLFRFSSATETATDTLFVDHQRTSHFESLDCPASVFHRIVNVRWKSQAAITNLTQLQEVVIANPNVTYENVEHLKVILLPSAQ